MNNILSTLSKEGYIIPKNDSTINYLDKIKNELTVEPFNYINLSKKSSKFSVYQEDDENLIVPKFYGIKKFGLPYINNESIGEKNNINFKGKLRDIQIEIINNVIPYINTTGGGVLCLPCAAGKTVLSLYLATYYKVKTLIIVHKTFLLNQWIERIHEFTDASVGIIKQNKIDIDNKDIVIGMLQSIAKNKYSNSIFNNFGMVIFDEAHHAPSQYFSRALPLITAKITIGLSATPKRADKLEKVLYWYFGDIMYQTQSEKNINVIVNIINYKLVHDKFREFKLKNGKFNRPITINNISTIGQRNKFIINLINDIIQNKKRKIIVLSDRIEHLKSLKNRLDKLNTTISDFYIGGMNQIALNNSAKNAQVIFATYAMAAEGLDIPDLNTLFMVTSRKEVEQAIGRIIRKIDPDIKPLVYDFNDLLPNFINQNKHRKKLYKKLGFEINNINVDNNIIINKISEQNFDQITESIDTNLNDCEFID